MSEHGHNNALRGYRNALLSVYLPWVFFIWTEKMDAMMGLDAGVERGEQGTYGSTSEPRSLRGKEEDILSYRQFVPNS